MDTSFRLKKEIKDSGLFSNGDRVIAAVSGGIDSIAMLELLADLKDVIGFELIVAHVNHKLRGKESERDEKFVALAAKRLGLKFISTSLKGLGASGENLQAAARALRYEFLKKCAARLRVDKIALGHTLDDQAETVLLHLVRGAGLDGLTGMPVVRKLDDRVSIVRPLLGVSRKEIVDFAIDTGLKFVEDSSNNSQKYSRNRLRHGVLDGLEELNSGAKRLICRAARTLELDRRALENMTARVFQKLAKVRKNEVLLDVRGFLKEEESIRARLIRRAFAEITGGKQDLLSDHIEKALSIALSGRSGGYFFPRGVRFSLNNGLLRLKKSSRT